MVQDSLHQQYVHNPLVLDLCDSNELANPRLIRSSTPFGSITIATWTPQIQRMFAVKGLKAGEMWEKLLPHVLLSIVSSRFDTWGRLFFFVCVLLFLFLIWLRSLRLEDYFMLHCIIMINIYTLSRF